MKYMSAVFRIFISVTMISSTSVSYGQAPPAPIDLNCANTTPPPTANTIPGATATPAPVAENRVGVGNEQGCNELRALHGALIHSNIANLDNGNPPSLLNTQRQKIVEGYERYARNRPKCIELHSTAASACLESLSPHIASTAATINTLLSTAGTAVTDNCSKFKTAMDIAKGGLTLYTAACGAAKAGCGGYCVAARSGLESMKRYAEVALRATGGVTCNPAVHDTPEKLAQCESGAKTTYRNVLLGLSGTRSVEQAVAGELERNSSNGSVAEKISLCTTQYAALAASAVSGIASLMGAFNQGNKCEDETTANPTPTASVADLTNKCQKEENKNLPECICMANPRTEGCSGSGGDRAGNNNSRSGLTTGDGSNGATRTVAGADLGSDTPMGIEPGAVNNSGGGAGASGSTGGGGSGLGGGSGGGSGGPNAAADGAGGKGLDTNILGGASGGGGGGYGGVGGSGDKYRQYLPGGAKDPAKGMAGQSAASREVTGQGGKSNFEKVKDRYIDNKKSLLNN